MSVLSALRERQGIMARIALTESGLRDAGQSYINRLGQPTRKSSKGDKMKAFLFIVIVVLPAVIIGISNLKVFPDSIWAATIMLVVTVGVAAVFTYQSGNATRRIARYCILADIGICAILSVNLGGHWLLDREITASEKGVAERHTEEDRESKRQAEQTDQRLKIAEAEREVLAAQAKAANAERRRLAELPIRERRSIFSAPATEAKPSATIKPLGIASMAAATSGPIAPRLTPEQVRAKWWWFLTALAIAECAASVVAGSVLAGIWEWDRNHDGIADHLQGKAPPQ